MRIQKKIYEKIFLFFGLFCLGFGLFHLPSVNLAFSSEMVNNQVKKSPQKRALLIGISEYEQKGTKGNWWNLDTALDIEFLQNVLINKYGFELKNMVILQDKIATKQRILQELKTIVSQTEKDDILFIYFTGHGALIADDEKNKDEIDGWDESLVPYDHKNNPANYIRDDEIALILDTLKTEQPGSVIVAFDSCYSGTATRGKPVSRGGATDIIRPANESPSGLIAQNASFPKEYVFLSASGSAEKAYPFKYDDKRELGIFTWALVEALGEVNQFTTYRDLFERIKNNMAFKRSGQNPQIEGSLDEVVFGGTTIAAEPYILIKPVFGNVPVDVVELPRGSLLGITEKSRFDVYLRETKDPNDAKAVKLAEGEIVKVSDFKAELKLNRKVSPDKLQAARAFETLHYYNDPPFKVLLKDLDKIEGGKRVLETFAEKDSNKSRNAESKNFEIAEFFVNSDEAQLDNNYDILISAATAEDVRAGTVNSEFSGVIIKRKSGVVLGKISAGRYLTEQIKTILKREKRFQKLKTLTNTNPLINIRLKISPVEMTKNFATNFKGQTELKLGEGFFLEVENKGSEKIFVSIFNLTTDGRVIAVFPFKDKSKNYSADLSGNGINGKQSLTFPKPFDLKGQTGEETIIAIATEDMVDLTPLADESIQLIRSARDENSSNLQMNPLGMLLLAANEGKRSPPTVPASWGISSVSYVFR